MMCGFLSVVMKNLNEKYVIKDFHQKIEESWAVAIIYFQSLNKS